MERLDDDVLEPGRCQLGGERVLGRETRLVDLGERREEAARPVAIEVLVGEGRDNDSAAVNEHACGLGERDRPIDEMDHERVENAVEPRITERQLLGAALLQADTARHPCAGDREHLGALLYAPDLGRSSLGERRGDRTRAAADVQDALTAQVTEPHDRVEPRPPRVARRPQPVIGRSACIEVGRARLGGHHAGDSARLRGTRAPRWTSRGSPRSGNGTSIVSKSRGTTVAGNSSRASSSTSRPP